MQADEELERGHLPVRVLPERILSGAGLRETPRHAHRHRRRRALLPVRLRLHLLGHDAAQGESLASRLCVCHNIEPVCSDDKIAFFIALFLVTKPRGIVSFFQDHMAICHPGKIYTCNTCSKVFLTKQNLVNHQAKHDPNLGFRCSHCSLSLTTKVGHHFVSLVSCS